MSDIPEEDWEKYLQETDKTTIEDKMMIEACMGCLSEEEQQIVILHAVAGLKHREIAGILSINLSTALSKYNRALKKMRKYIREGER